jgi:O-antigen/teichoic acid export membrane protein
MTRSFSLLGQWIGILSWQALALLLAAMTAALAAAFVPPEIFARYSLMLSIVQIGYAVGFAWLNHAMFRFAREECARHGTIAGATRPAIVGHALILLALCIGTALVAEPLARWSGLPPSAFIWCGTGLAALVGFETATYAAQAGGRFDGYGSAQVLVKAGPLVAALGCAVAVPDHRLLFAGLLGGWLAGLARVAAVARWHGPARAGTAARMLRYGWRLPLASAAGMVVAWFAVWSLHLRVGAAAAGIYAWAAALVALAQAVLLPLSALLAPRMVDLFLARDAAALRMAVGRAVAVSLLFAAMMPIGLSAVALGAGAALPDAYGPATPVLVMLCAALPAQLLSYLLSPLLMADETLVGAVTRANVLAAALLAIGTWFALPLASMTGVAAVAAVSVWTLAGVWLVLASRLSGTGPAALRRWAMTGLAIGGSAMAIAMLAPVAASALGMITALALLGFGRGRAWFRPVAELAVHLPRRRIVDRFMQWCAA